MALVVHRLNHKKELGERSGAEAAKAAQESRRPELKQEAQRLKTRRTEIYGPDNTNYGLVQQTQVLAKAKRLEEEMEVELNKQTLKVQEKHDQVITAQSALLTAEQELDFNEHTVRSEADAVDTARARVDAWQDKNVEVAEAAGRDKQAAEGKLADARKMTAGLKQKLKETRTTFNSHTLRRDDEAAHLATIKEETEAATQKVAEADRVLGEFKQQLRHITDTIASKQYEIDACNAAIGLSQRRIEELEKLIRTDSYLKYECTTARRLYMAQRVVTTSEPTRSKRIKRDPSYVETERIYKNAIGMWRIGTVSDSRASGAPGSGVESHALAVTAFVDIRWQRMYDLRAKFGAGFGGDVVEHLPNPDDGSRGEDYNTKLCDDAFDGGVLYHEVLQRSETQKRWQKMVRNTVHGKDGLPPRCLAPNSMARPYEPIPRGLTPDPGTSLVPTDRPGTTTVTDASMQKFYLLDYDGNGLVTQGEFFKVLSKVCTAPRFHYTRVPSTCAYPRHYVVICAVLNTRTMSFSACLIQITRCSTKTGARNPWGKRNCGNLLRLSSWLYRAAM